MYHCILLFGYILKQYIFWKSATKISKIQGQYPDKSSTYFILNQILFLFLLFMGSQSTTEIQKLQFRNFQKKLYIKSKKAQCIIKKQDRMSKSANDFKEEGNKYFKAQNYQQAIKSYSSAIQLNPNQPSYYSNRAACYLNQKKFDKTIQDCNKALKIDPNQAKALRRRALAYMNLLKFDESIVDFKKALTVDKDLTIQREMEDCQALQKNYKQIFDNINENNFSEALLSLNYILNKVDNRPDLLLIKCQLLAKTGDTDQAKNVLRRLQNGGVTNGDLNYLKGLIELYSGDSSKAKKFFMQGLKYDPDNQKLKNTFNNAKKGQQLKEKGNELLKANKFKQAGDVYSEALLLDPSNKKLNSILFSNRALTFMKQKKWLNALDDLNKSLELDPKYTKSLVRRAEVNTQRQDYTAAIHDYSKIQEVDPSCNFQDKIKGLRTKQKKAKKKDYYAIMGLTKPSSDAQIKKAYKKLAVQFHPDKNRHKSEAQQGDAEKKFRDLNQAYEVLSDAKKKQMYDSGQMDFDDSGMGGADFDGAHMGGMGGMGGMNGMSGMGGMDPNDIFKMFFSQGGFGGMDGFEGFSGGSGPGFKFSSFNSGGGKGGKGGMGGMGGMPDFFKDMGGAGGKKFNFKYS